MGTVEMSLPEPEKSKGEKMWARVLSRYFPYWKSSLFGQTGDWLALQDLIMMLPSRLGCPLSLKTPNMGNPGLVRLRFPVRRRAGTE